MINWLCSSQLLIHQQHQILTVYPSQHTVYAPSIIYLPTSSITFAPTQSINIRLPPSTVSKYMPPLHQLLMTDTINCCCPPPHTKSNYSINYLCLTPLAINSILHQLLMSLLLNYSGPTTQLLRPYFINYSASFAN